MADPASRATVKTVGGILLVAFIGTFFGLYVHGQNSNDIQSGFVFNVSPNRFATSCACKTSQLAPQSPPEAIMFNQDGGGSLVPSNADDSEPLLPEMPASVRSRAVPPAVAAKALAATAAAARSKPGIIHGSSKKVEALSRLAHSKQTSGKQTSNRLQEQRAKSEQKQTKQFKQRLVNHNNRKLEPATLKPMQSAASGHKNQLATKHSARVSAGIVSPKAVRKMEDRITNDLVDAFKCTVGTGCLEHTLKNAENDAEKIFSGPFSKVKQLPSQSRITRPLDVPVLGPEISVINTADSKHFWQEAAKIAETGLPRKTGNSAATFVKQMAAARHDVGSAVAAPAASTKGPMSRTNDKTFK